MRMIACIGALLCVGCSFFSGRVEEYDAKVEKQEKLIDQLKAEIRALPEDIPSGGVNKRGELATMLADAEARLMTYVSQRDRALTGKEQEDVAIRGWITAILAAAGGVLKVAGKAAV